jgi:hypothetical protein
MTPEQILSAVPDVVIDVYEAGWTVADPSDDWLTWIPSTLEQPCYPSNSLASPQLADSGSVTSVS